MMPESQPIYKSDLDKGFNTDEIKTLTKYKLYAPSDVLKGVQNEEVDFDVYDKDLGKKLQKLGAKKRSHYQKVKRHEILIRRR